MEPRARAWRAALFLQFRAECVRSGVRLALALQAGDPLAGSALLARAGLAVRYGPSRKQLGVYFTVRVACFGPRRNVCARTNPRQHGTAAHFPRRARPGRAHFILTHHYSCAA